MAILSTVKNALSHTIKETASKLNKLDSKFVPHPKSNFLFNYSDKIHKPLTFVPGSHYTLKKKYAVGVPLAIAAIGAGNDIRQKTEDAKIGDMYADELSGSVNISRSPTLDAYLNQRDSEKATTKDIASLTQQNPMTLRTGNASGDLVFALHNLKNGGR